MTERADLLVLDYLRRVADAAHGRLRWDERLDFVARLRARIEEMRAQAGAEEPTQVERLLARFGDPVRLVERERHRRDEEAGGYPRPDGAAQGRTAGVSARAGTTTAATARATAAGSAGAVGTAGPEAQTYALTRPIFVPGRGRDVPSPGSPGASGGRGRSAAPTTPEAAAGWGAASAPAPQTGSAWAGPQPPGAGRPTPPGAPGADPVAERRGLRTRPGAPGGPVWADPVTDPGAAGRRVTTARGGRDLLILAWRYRLEVASLLMMGMGGLATLLLWPVGAVLAVASQTWRLTDKWLGVFGPLVAAAMFVGGLGAAHADKRMTLDFGAYWTAARTTGPTAFRAAAVLGVGYLAVRLYALGRAGGVLRRVRA